jgi:nucleotide-binding universal stress UspA family protein
MYSNILVPTDGSDITAKAVQTAIGLAKTPGRALVDDQREGAVSYSAISEMQPVPPQSSTTRRSALPRRA